MKKLYFMCAALLLFLCNSFAQISLISGTYSQNFNTLASSGTSSTVPTGWAFSESGTNANATYTAGTGSGNAGDTYSFGAVSNTERAFGGLLSGSLTPIIGAGFVNNTGNTITELIINYTGEQWRLGATGRTDRLDFQYSLTATSLTTGTWLDVNNLDFIAPISAGTVGALDGNNAANRTSVSFTITGLSIANGSIFYIRWNDFNASGADDGLAVDDFSLSFTLGGTNTASVSAGNNGNEGSANGTFNINLTEPAPVGGTTIAYTLSGSATQGAGNDYTDPNAGSVTIAAGNSSAIITLNINDDALFEPTESIILTLTNATNNVTWNATPASISLIDNEATQIAYNDFNTCTSTLSDGYSQWSVTGAQVWGCTTFGRISNGVQMNGFSSGNQLNEDWLISPGFNLSSTNVPILAFFSRTTFAGDQLNLYVSTNYVSGDPTAPGVTWTEIDGRFPNEFSDAWTQSQMINLSAFKTANVHFAYKYNSTTSAASRITLDDIYVLDASAAPPPTLTTHSTLLDFRYVNSGGTSASKTFTFWANDLTTDLTITAPTGFVISKDGTTFGSSVTFTPGETTNQLKTLYVRFAPSSANTSYGGYLDFNTTGFNHDRVFIKGNSYDPTTTLNIVNWNIEWFGATGQGPTNEAQQSANAETVMEFLNADAYALSEIVSETALNNLVDALGAPGDYDYVLADWCSNGASAAACATSQKTAFVYKTSVMSNIYMRPLLQSSTNPNNADNWANGRYPMLVRADVSKNGDTRTIFFIVLHAEAGDTQSDYLSRLNGINELKDTLDATLYFTNTIILGDFNDDLDISIYDANGPTVSSYTDLISDSTDADSYESITLPLSHFGLHSHYANADMIDHVVISNEVAPGYVDLSATLYNDIGALTGIVNYETTTSDHYPVMTQFVMAAVLPVKLVSFSAVKENKTVLVKWKTAQEINSKEFVIERSKDGFQFEDIGTVQAAGFSLSPRNYQYRDMNPAQGYNYYRLRSVDHDASFSHSSVVRVRFGSSIVISVRPNPAVDHVNVISETAVGATRITLVDMHGRALRTVTTNLQANQPYRFSLNVPKGVYVMRIENDAETQFEKIVIR